MTTSKIKIREYDLNVYVVDGVLRLSAYQYQYSDHPTNPIPIATKVDNDSWITLALPLDPFTYGEEIAYLLGDPAWAELDDTDTALADKWQDYDGPWDSVEWLSSYDAPQMLQDWVNGLPEYEPESVHDWTDAPYNLEYGETRDVPCKNCSATYQQRRLSWGQIVGLGLPVPHGELFGGER